MTSPLGFLERTLTALFEGAVERFLRVRVQPVHLARRLETAMSDGALVSIRGPVAPNHYVIGLAPADHLRFSGAAAGLQRELERHLQLIAGRNGLRNHDPFSVELRADPAQAEGRFTVEASFLSRSVSLADSPPGHAAAEDLAPVEHTQVMPVTPRPAPLELAEAVLEVMGAQGVLRAVPLRGGRCAIGRAEDNDLVLPEVAVSRQHAVVRRQGDGYFIEDLDSTNGLKLNGRRIKAGPVKDGDHLQVGGTALVFRIRSAGAKGSDRASV